MKIRIKGNSLRLRLTQTEVIRFLENGEVAETIQFGVAENQKLIYQLAKYSKKEIGVAYQPGKIVVLIPNAMALDWAQSEKVGMNSILAIDDQTTLTILVEKDFQCMKPRAGEDENDLFINPQA